MMETTTNRHGAPAARLVRSVVLVGMMGAGKTAVGKVLAQELDAEIRDSDAEIEASAQLSIAEIFERYGEAFFREKESAVIARLLVGPPCILSTGGGAWMSAANREMLGAHAMVLWLKADLELLWQRVRHKTTRPLLRTADPRASLAALYQERAPIYALAPHHLTVEPDWSVEEMAAQVLAKLAAAGAVEGYQP